MALERIKEVVVQEAFRAELIVLFPKFAPVVAQPVVVVAEDRAGLERVSAEAVVGGQGARRPGRRHVRSPAERLFDRRVDVRERVPVLCGSRQVSVSSGLVLSDRHGGIVCAETYIEARQPCRLAAHGVQLRLRGAHPRGILGGRGEQQVDLIARRVAAGLDDRSGLGVTVSQDSATTNDMRRGVHETSPQKYF